MCDAYRGPGIHTEGSIRYEEVPNMHTEGSIVYEKHLAWIQRGLSCIHIEVTIPHSGASVLAQISNITCH